MFNAPVVSSTLDPRLYRIGYDYDDSIFLALIRSELESWNLVVESSPDYNDLYAKCKERGMVFDGLDDVDMMPLSYFRRGL